MDVLDEQIAALIAEAANPDGAMTHKEMPNGEQRFSVEFPGGEWILTVAGREGGWQNAHYHGGPMAYVGLSAEGVCEHYVVQRGWMVVAIEHHIREQGHLVYSLEESDQVTFHPGQAHNLYLPAGAIITTVKSGKPVGNPEKGGNDWWPHMALDEWSKQMQTHDQILLKSSGLWSDR